MPREQTQPLVLNADTTFVPEGHVQRDLELVFKHIRPRPRS